MDRSDRSRRMTTTGLLSAMALTSALLAPAVSAGEARPALVVRHAGVDRLMPDERDGQLRAAIHMFGTRLAELPAEIARLEGRGHDPEEIEVFQKMVPLIAALVEEPIEFAILDNGVNDLGVPDVDMRLVIRTSDPGQASSFRDAVAAALKSSGANLPLNVRQDDPGILQIQTPIGLVMFGVPRDTNTFTAGLDFGGDGLNTSPLPLAAMAELGGAEPVMEALVDVQVMADIADRFITMFGGAEGTAGFQQARTTFLGSDPVQFQAATAFADSRLIMVSRTVGFDMPGVSGADLPIIPMDVLRLIPEDTRYASVQSFDLGAFLNEIARLSMGMSNVGFVRAEQAIGINPLTDLLAHLGPVWVSYMSDTTGGGGIMSSVFVNSGINRDALQKTLDKLTAMAGPHTAQIPYVRLRTLAATTSGGPTIYRVSFPGVPVPAELSLALQGDRLVAAITTQALDAALGQVSSGSPSILDNESFAADANGRLNDLTAVGFIDTPRTIDRGYPFVQLVGTAIQNMVRSPVDESRDPGLVTPAFHVLSRNARATTWFTRKSNGESVSIVLADSSWLVNAAGWTGGTNALPILAAAGAAASAAAAETTRDLHGEFEHFDHEDDGGHHHDDNDEEVDPIEDHTAEEVEPTGG